VTKPEAVYGRDAHIYNQYVITVDGRREDLRAFLSENGVGCEVYYPVPFHEQKCFAYLGYDVGAFPVSEHAARNTLAIPVYPELTTKMQDYVIAKIGEFLDG
jgi:dTDP-4-amino-4,6-dideoxygalactose transaminase